MLYGQIAVTHLGLVPDHTPLAVDTASTATASTAMGPPLVSPAHLSMR